MSREYASFFTEDHRLSIDNMCEALGDQVVSSMLSVLTPEQQIHIVEGFARYGTAAQGTLHAEAANQGARAREAEAEITRLQAAGRALEESLRHARASEATRSVTRQKGVKLDVAKYGGTESEPLLRWLLQVTTAADAQQIVDEATRVAFALSFLKGRAEEWAYSLLLADPLCFESFYDFQQQLKAVFLPPNSDFRHRSKFLVARQGKRSIREFVNELRYFAACLNDSQSLPEDIRVTVFMHRT